MESNERTPTLADLIATWLEERKLNARVEGPDAFYSGLYYIDANAPISNNGEWLADIDNNAGEVFIRINREVMVTLDAAHPEFFTMLEAHIKAYSKSTYEH